LKPPVAGLAGGIPGPPTVNREKSIELKLKNINIYLHQVELVVQHRCLLVVEQNY
jgi:hypothetical protein